MRKQLGKKNRIGASLEPVWLLFQNVLLFQIYFSECPLTPDQEIKML